MTDKRLRRMPLRIVLKQAACTYLLTSPVLAYYIVTSFEFAKKSPELFLSLVVLCVVASIVFVVTTNMTSMRWLRRCIQAMHDGTADKALIEKAARSTFRFPNVHGAVAFLSWTFVPTLGMLVPFLLLHAVTAIEAGGVIALAVSTGIVTMPMFKLISESERARFLQLPEVGNTGALIAGGKSQKLSRKIILNLLALLSYPVAVFTTLILLSNSGSMDLHGSSLGLVLLILVTFACSLLVGILISRSITKPLQEASDVSEEISQGHLDRDLTVTSNDEVGRLSSSLNSMSARLRSMVESIRVNSQEVASSSDQIRSSAAQLAEGSQNQASTLEETSASVEELAASINQVAENAQSQASAVDQGSSSMAQVHHSIEETSKDFEEIASLASTTLNSALEGARAVSEVVDGINLIAGSSEKITGIVTLISEIADQTNLLALNAAIEAARAGEHGRGFSVVADEVGKLAERSSQSTKEIEALIKESVKSVEKGIEKAKGSQLAMQHIGVASQQVQEMIARLSQSMRQQVDAVKELAQALSSISAMSQNISVATEEQITNATQVSRAVENVNDITQSAASAAEQMSASTQQLSRMARELQELVSQFTTGRGGEHALMSSPALTLAALST